MALPVIPDLSTINQLINDETYTTSVSPQTLQTSVTDFPLLYSTFDTSFMGYANISGTQWNKFIQNTRQMTIDVKAEQFSFFDMSNNPIDISNPYLYVRTLGFRDPTLNTDWSSNFAVFVGPLVKAFYPPTGTQLYSGSRATTVVSRTLTTEELSAGDSRFSFQVRDGETPNRIFQWFGAVTVQLKQFENNS